MSTVPLAERARWRSPARRFRAVGSGWFARTTFARKWLVLGTLIGIIAGLGAVCFFEALQLATHLLLGVLAGYQVPTPAGEGSHAASAIMSRPWAIPLVTGGGGLASALIVYHFAPDAEGHGTDAAIRAVHDNPRGISLRTVVVKIIASALTIGSGGSGGREGPTGQISAGFGSALSRLFDLSPADARIAVSTGIGSGIGSIFGAPLGGAVLATEILYRDDFEVEALLPCFIASIVGFALFGAIEGYGPMFGFVGNYVLRRPVQLAWFAVIGVVGGVVGLAYAKGFYGMGALFERLPVPRWLRPAIGGAIVGLLALAVPEVLGTGYGWVQAGLGRSLAEIPLWVVLVCPLARIFATGCSIGSGGSGGIFGPGMVIGAFVGAGIYDLLSRLGAPVGHDPAPYVVVGMMACFGSISRAPLAVMLMVAEMTGTLTLVIPAMVAVGLATLIVRRDDDTIYRSQLRNRAESPAHRILTGLPLLSHIAASEAMARPRLSLRSTDSATDAMARMREVGVSEAPLADAEGRYAGVVRLPGLEEISSEGAVSLGRLADAHFSPMSEARHLNEALEIMTTTSQSWIPVTDQDRRVVGTLSISDMVRAYRQEMQATLRKVAGLTGSSGIYEVELPAGSPLAGKTLALAHLPRGVVVTAIERARAVLVPDGGTVLGEGDRLMLIGSGDEVAVVRNLAELLEEGPSAAGTEADEAPPAAS